MLCRLLFQEMYPMWSNRQFCVTHIWVKLSHTIWVIAELNIQSFYLSSSKLGYYLDNKPSPSINSQQFCAIQDVHHYRTMFAASQIVLVPGVGRLSGQKPCSGPSFHVPQHALPREFAFALAVHCSSCCFPSDCLASSLIAWPGSVGQWEPP